MFKPMRRTKQQLPHEEVLSILEKSTSGTLALITEEGYPYAIPLSYVYNQGKLYFHSAKTGLKIDAIKHCDKASFCIIDQDLVIPEKYATLYRSIIAFGKVRLLENVEDIKAVAFSLGEKYNPNHPKECNDEINISMPALAIIEMTIEQITGKEAKDLMLQREQKA